MCACEKCGSVKDVSVYNDFGDNPGNLICDACVFAAMDPGPVCVVMPSRPEGYYHQPIGTFACDWVD